MDRREVSPIPRGKRTTSMMDADDLAHQAAQEGNGRLFKMEVDYTSQVDEALHKADAIAKTGNVTAAVESLSPLEKQTRLGSDMKSNARLVQHMVQMCFKGAVWPLLNETVVSLSKKRGIIKLSIARMVRDCCEMIDQMPDEKSKTKLTETLRQVTVDKIYVEVERARLTGRMVKKLELEGNLDEAASMLLEVPVETYGSMEMKEKVEFLLEQLRLCVLRKDFIRGSIISKKISVRFFADTAESVQELKLKYYDMMIKLGLNDNAYLDVCRYYRQVYDTPLIKPDTERSKQVLKCVTLYVLLAQYTNEQWDLLNTIAGTRQLELSPDYKSLLELFINQEVISWKEKVLAHYETLLRLGAPGKAATDVFDNNPKGNARWIDLKTRVAEHNLRLIYKYYTKITFQRMAELLEYPVEEMEAFLCHQIESGAISDARIERPAGVINMRAKTPVVEQLDHWADSVRKITGILHQVETLMIKEKMVHQDGMLYKQLDDSDNQGKNGASASV